MAQCIGHKLIVLPLHHSVAVLTLMEKDVQYSGHHEIFHKLIYSQKYLFVGSSSLPSICLPPSYGLSLQDKYPVLCVSCCFLWAVLGWLVVLTTAERL